MALVHRSVEAVYFALARPGLGWLARMYTKLPDTAEATYFTMYGTSVTAHSGAHGNVGAHTPKAIY